MTGPAFVRAGVPCARSDDVRVHLWTKLTANCASNALSALSQQCYGVFAADAGVRGLMDRVTDEIAAAARRVPGRSGAGRASDGAIAGVTGCPSPPPHPGLVAWIGGRCG